MAKLKNDLERIRYDKEMKHLLYNEQLIKGNLKKREEILRNDFKRMIAYGCICKAHSFDKYDPFLNRRHKHHRDSNVKKESENDTNTESEVHLPKLPKNTKRSIHFDEGSSSIVTNSVASSSEVSTGASDRLTLPKLHSPGDTDGEDNISSVSDMEQTIRGTREDSTLMKMSTLATGFHALILWKQKIHGGLHQNKPSSEPPMRNSHSRIIKDAKLKQKHENRRTSVFPGDCKTPATMRRFIDHEVESFLFNVKSDKRKNKARKILEKLHEPQFVQRNKSTSAIFRDFRSYKGIELQQGENSDCDGKVE